MAIVRIDFSQCQAEELGRQLAMAVNATMHQVLKVPPNENYLVCQRHPTGMLLHDPGTVQPERLARIVFIQITLNQGRSPELKAAFFSQLNRNVCNATGLQPEDVFVNLVEVARENWSFGQLAG
jgi:4-oxalocrotonate tautomerase